MTGSCWQLGIISPAVEWSVSRRQRANESVLCAIKRVCPLLIVLHGALDLRETVLTAPGRPSLTTTSPPLPIRDPVLSLFAFWVCVKEGYCVRHAPALRPAHSRPCFLCRSCLLPPLEVDHMQSGPAADRRQWSGAASSALGCCRRRLRRGAHVSPEHLSPEEMESLWELDQASVDAEDKRGGELITHKAKRHERKRQELLALALGVKLGSKGTLLWKPIKLLASCPQISSPLVRRSALKDTPEKQCSYEKIHNFKVSGYLLNVLMAANNLVILLHVQYTYICLFMPHSP